MPIDVITITLNPALDRTVRIDNFTPGCVNRVVKQHERAGGKGVNVAVALANAGVAVAAAGFLGARNSGRFEALFAAHGIADHFVRLPGETRVGIKIIDPARQETTDINFPGLEPTAGDLAACRRRIEELAGPGCVAVLAGSLPPGVPSTLYADWIGWLKDRGVQILTDASGAALRAAAAAGPHVLKPNVSELEELVGEELPNERAAANAARTLLRGETALVVVSMGATGACFVAPDREFVAEPPAVEVVSTVGAGDALVAGLVFGHCRGLPLEETARLATAFAMDRLTHLDAGLTAPGALGQNARRVRLRPIA